MIVNLRNKVGVDGCELLTKSNKEDFSTGSKKSTELKMKKHFLLQYYLSYWTDEQIKEISCDYVL